MGCLPWGIHRERVSLQRRERFSQLADLLKIRLHIDGNVAFSEIDDEILHDGVGFPL